MRLIAWLATMQLLATAGCAYPYDLVESFDCSLFNSSGPQSVSRLRGLSCFVCSCKEDVLRCQFGRCGSREACHVTDDKWPGCKSCRLAQHGVVLSHGMWWSPGNDSCRVMRCSAGVVTESTRICHPPCSPDYYVWIAGECCPRCYGCNPSHVTNLPIQNGETVRPFSDQAVLCNCDGHVLSCFKEVCQLPNCPRHAQQPAGLCLHCRPAPEAAAAAVPSHQCFFQGRSYPNSTTWNVDTCTNCSCQHGTVMCRRHNCPVLECSQKDHFKEAGACCPVCRNSQDCVDPSGRRYQHEEEWQADKCSRCVCRSGQISCRRPECGRSAPCKPGSQLEQAAGDCCPRCVERYGSCSTLGEPLLRTFDAGIVRFESRCKYTLTRMCGARHSRFRIRFVHKRRRRALQISMLHYRLSVGAGYRLRLNGHRTSISHVRSEGWLSVAVLHNYLQVRLRNGVTVMWDGTNFLEIRAPKALSGLLCGLCGNYNGNSKDDRIGPRGEMLGSESEFTRAWREGFCRAEHRRPSQCLLKRRQRSWVRAYCRRLRHLPCGRSAAMQPYFHWCKEEMCKCRRDTPQKCLCPVVRTVLRHCARKGRPVTDLSDFPCAGRRICPKRFAFSNCACARGCDDGGASLGRCSRRRCRRGCVCRGRRLLHRGRCVLPRRCPRRRRHLRRRRRP